MGGALMDPEFKDFFDELGLPDPEAMVVDEEPPEAVSAEKLQAFHRRELSGPDAEWVAFLISRYRAWHEADRQIILASVTDVSTAPETNRVRREEESLGYQIRKYLTLAYMDLLGQLPLFVPAAVHADLLAPYRSQLRRVVCEEWDWASQRGNPTYADPTRLTEAVAEAIGRHASEFPFPPALLAAILVKEGLDDFCNLEDSDE